MENNDDTLLTFVLVVIFTGVLCLYGYLNIKMADLLRINRRALPQAVVEIKRADNENKQPDELIFLELVCSGLYVFPAYSAIGRHPSLLTKYTVPDYYYIEKKIVPNRYDDYGNPYLIQLSNGMLVINPRLDKRLIIDVIEAFFALTEFDMHVSVFPLACTQIEVNKEVSEFSAENIFSRITRYWIDNFF